MVKRYLVVFALSALVLPGQEAKEAAFDEVAFRKAVQDGRLEGPRAVRCSLLSSTKKLRFRFSWLESRPN